MFVTECVGIITDKPVQYLDPYTEKVHMSCSTECNCVNSHLLLTEPSFTEAIWWHEKICEATFICRHTHTHIHGSKCMHTQNMYLNTHRHRSVCVLEITHHRSPWNRHNWHVKLPPYTLANRNAHTLCPLTPTPLCILCLMSPFTLLYNTLRAFKERRETVSHSSLWNHTSATQ